MVLTSVEQLQCYFEPAGRIGPYPTKGHVLEASYHI